jgi:hypothetical protein
LDNPVGHAAKSSTHSDTDSGMDIRPEVMCVETERAPDKFDSGGISRGYGVYQEDKIKSNQKITEF